MKLIQNYRNQYSYIACKKIQIFIFSPLGKFKHITQFTILNLKKNSTDENL